MKTFTFLTTLLLVLSAVAVPMATAQTSPVTVDYNDEHPINPNVRCVGIYLNGAQMTCVPGTPLAQGAAASFGIGDADTPTPILASSMEGEFTVTVTVQQGDGVTYKAYGGDITLSIKDVQGAPVHESTVKAGAGGKATFTFTVPDTAGALVSLTAAVNAPAADGSPNVDMVLPYSLPAELAFQAGELGAADVVQQQGVPQPVLLVTAPAAPTLDADEDGVPDVVDNCPPVAGEDTANPGQEDADLDRVGDMCDDEPHGFPMGDPDGDGIPYAIEDALFEAGLIENANDANDKDGDGVDNDADQCDDTVPGMPVDEEGCDSAPEVPVNPLDLDGDGVLTPDDQCPATTEGATVDSDGCAPGDTRVPPSELPAGVITDEAGTPTGVWVDTDGDGRDEDGSDDVLISDLTSAADPDGDGQIHIEGVTPIYDPVGGALVAGDNCPTVANADQADMDKDGVGDACDPDADGDDVLDTDDNCLGLANKNQVNTDKDFPAQGTMPAGDDKGDACDDDDDADGVLDVDDVFPLDRSEWADADNDGIGDNADLDDTDGKTGDQDGDGVLNGDDNCPTVINVDQLNTDKGYPAQNGMPAGDAKGDACDLDDDADGRKDLGEDGVVGGTGANADDAFPLDRTEWLDSDGDGIGDNADPDDNDGPLGDKDFDTKANGVDNCPDNANADQLDTDGDTKGDACDNDDDADGLDDGADNCPLVANVDQADLDKDGRGDACDPDKDGDGKTDHATPVPTCVVASAKDDPKDRFPSDPTEWKDSDCDGTGDNADPAPFDATVKVDSDGDGVGDGSDNCPAFVNPNQKDGDGDGKGDVCDDNLTDGPKGDKDGDGFSNKVETDAGSDPADAKSVPTDWDGDGWSNEDEINMGTLPRDATSKPAGTAPSEVEKQTQLKELSRKVGVTLTGKSTFGANDTLSVTLKFKAPEGAAGLQVLRSQSPYQVLATLPATATTYTDTTATVGAKYMVIAYASGGVGKVLENVTKELTYVPSLESEGQYFQAVKPVKSGSQPTFQNGNTQEKQVNVTVEVYDANGKLIRVENQAIKVPAHGETTLDVKSINTKGGASYEVIMDNDDGQRTVLASGVITQGPEIDTSILWLIAGGILLAGIIALMVAGIVAYARQPEETETA